MATISERAMFAYPMFKTEDSNRVEAARSGYIKGATDQRKVDIERAYHALEKVVSKEVLEELKKTMEE